MIRLSPLHPGYVITLCADASAALVTAMSIEENMAMCDQALYSGQARGPKKPTGQEERKASVVGVGVSASVRAACSSVLLGGGRVLYWPISKHSAEK